MRGEFIGVWPQMWDEIWMPLLADHEFPGDVFCELYRDLSSALISPPSVNDLADIVDNPVQAEQEFRAVVVADLAGERQVVTFLENAFDSLDDLSGDELTNSYFNLIADFIVKYSLRYDLRRPFTLCPTIQGVFANLVRDLRDITSRDPHLDALMKEYEDAVRDLRHDNSDTRIKTCIQKQVNLLEGIGQACPGVSRNTLGAICEQVGTWPHDRLKDAVKTLYGFTCDYPGIRHGGTYPSALRTLDMRDLVALSVLLLGCTPYLEHRLAADEVFGGGLGGVPPIPATPIAFAPARLPWWRRVWHGFVYIIGR